MAPAGTAVRLQPAGRSPQRGPLTRVGAISLVASIALGACSDDTPDSASPTGDAVDAGIADADDHAGQGSWLSVDLDSDNTRAVNDQASPGPDQVAALAPVWELDGIGGFSATPIVAEGTLYAGDWNGTVHALDADNGDTLWEQPLDGSRIQASVALDDHHVYAGTFGATFAALDRATGDVIWEAPLDEHPFASAFTAPVVVDDLVIVGVGSYENMVASADDATFRGSVVAYDTRTGDEQWRYWTTTGDDEEGAGVGVWTSPAVDPGRGHLYIGTGQHHAQPTSERSDAVIALDIATGEEQWVHQYTEGDTWTAADGGIDADVSSSPNLFSIDGQDVVGAGDKAGTYRVMDRDSGDEIWAQELTDGGLQGGVMATAAVADGRIFVLSNHNGATAELFALDHVSGDTHWSHELDSAAMGPVTWAAGVVYVADNSGTLSAFDARDGQPLWSYAVDAQSATGFALVDGTIYAGYGWWLADSTDDAAGGLIAFRIDGDADGNLADDDGGGPGSGDGATDASPDAAALYQQSCATCHGGDGSGASGPALTDLDERLSTREQRDIIAEGRGEMPAWEGSLSPDEIAALIDYLGEV